MKKMLGIILCCFTLVGCTGIETRMENYRSIEYNNDHYDLEDVEWRRLENEIRQLDPEGREMEWDNREEHNMLSIWDVESLEGKKTVKALQSFVGEELIGFIDEIKNSDEDSVKERVINQYGIVGAKQEGIVSIRVIKSKVSLADKDTEVFLKGIVGSDYVLKRMYIAADEQMLEVASPIFIRNDYKYGEEKNSTYYQVFRKNSGEITKLRLVMVQFDENKEVDNYLSSLQKFVEHMSGQSEDILKLQGEIMKVYEYKERQNSGVISDIKYKVTRYQQRKYERGDIIEVVLDVK